ncbi:MAG: tryptophan--tRNA ligase, partial [bacterium]
VRASQRADVQSFYFLADYHALIKVEDPARIQRSTLEIAASWLACGLNPERVTFYRQSDIPEIPELTWFLTCVLGKGVLNRAHAYKASVDKNTAAGIDPDADVSAGLFMYPVLMGADILMFNAHKVPVGRDQIQHIEMARDMANSFNHRYGEHFVPPEAEIEESVATLPGLDGRKMSKSYDNTIPLFAPRAQLQKLIGGIVTDSRAPGEPKAVEGSALFQIYQAFATPAETDGLRQAYADAGRPEAWRLDRHNVGHVETAEDRVEHLQRLRDLQDETKGFTAFICWTFQEENTRLRVEPAGAHAYLRTQALARIFLDNFDNVQSSWVTQGPKIGQVALQHGANDLGSIMLEENVVSSAGTRYRMTVPEMRQLISELGYEPRQRDNEYRLMNLPA